MRECERLFGLAEGVEIHSMVERVLGACPCARTRRCILLALDTEPEPG